MLVSREREKMFNALVYFSQNVLNPGKTKLFKLLNFLDYAHFQKTGRSVTGLRYAAWERGPVPVDLYKEWKNPSQEFIGHFLKKKVAVGQFTREELNPTHKFDSKLFSKFELMLMEDLAKKHFKDNAESMSELSHFEFGYWAEVWNEGIGEGKEIPYELVLLRRNNEEDKKVMKRYIEDQEIRDNYR
jgi:uncharacterized phage-associated protein